MQHWAVIVLVMVGGGALVLCSYAVLRNFADPDKEDNYGFSDQQVAYMRSVRQQNLDNLYAEMASRGYPRPKRPSMSIFAMRQNSRGGETTASSDFV